MFSLIGRLVWIGLVIHYEVKFSKSEYYDEHILDVVFFAKAVIISVDGNLFLIIINCAKDNKEYLF